MVTASCHCGAVSFEAAYAPQTVTDCNCSICRRLGALWAYYQTSEVTIVGGQASGVYVRHDGPDQGTLGFHHCRTCGCTTHWMGLDPAVGRMAINARLMDPQVLAAARVRRFDGADTWRELEDD